MPKAKNVLLIAQQSAFDCVCVAMRQQARPALNRVGRAAYEASYGGQTHYCSVGCLMTAQELDHLRRGKRSSATIEELGSTFVSKLVKRLGCSVNFLVDLQEAHDDVLDESDWLSAWKGRMKRVAKKHRLSAVQLR